MASTISKYFSERVGVKENRGKRKQSSSSSVSDVSNSPEEIKTRSRQELKKQRKDSDSRMEEEMTLQEAVCELKASMTKLASKDDISLLRDDMEKLRSAFSMRIEKLESSVFELENERDQLKTELSTLKGEKKELEAQLAQHTKEMGDLKRGLNDQEQHGRQWNLRVYGVQEPRGETVQDCVTKCVDLFAKKLGVPTAASDIDIAHRSGKVVTPGSGGRPRPIIVRFLSRRHRGLVLTARRKLKQSGISVGEDLTHANYRLLRQVSNHSAVMSAWTSNGKIISKLKNGKTVKVDVYADINHLFAGEMA